jgi:hypothetical protein
MLLKKTQGETDKHFGEIPPVQVFQQQISDLPRLRENAKVYLTWPAEGFTYTIALSHRKPNPEVYWQFYRTRANESVLLWQHQTNDVLLLYNLILQETSRMNVGVQIEGALGTPHQLTKSSKEGKSNPFIEADMKENLRHFLSPSGNASTADTPSGNKNFIPVHDSRKESKASPCQQSMIGAIDLQIGRNFLARTFFNELNIVSFTAFLFCLEQEFSRAVYTSRTPLSLIVIGPYLVTGDGQTRSFPKDGLHETAREIKQKTRKTDILALYQSDALAILLPETSSTGSEIVARKLNESLKGLRYTDPLTNKSTNTGLAFGIATVNENINTLGKFLGAAEQACLHAQKTGHMVCLYDQVKQSKEAPSKIIDTYAVSQLLWQLVSMKDGMFSFPVLVSFLEREFHLAKRGNLEQYMLLLKIPSNLPLETHKYVISVLLSKLYSGDRFGHFNFQDNEIAIIRPKASLQTMHELAKHLCDSLSALTPIEAIIVLVERSTASDTSLNLLGVA